MRTNYTAQGGYSTPPNKLKYDVTLHVCYFELSSFAKGAPKKKEISSIGKKGTPFRACWKNRKRRCINVGSRLVIYILAGWSADGINLVRENARVKLLYGDLNRLEGHLKKKEKQREAVLVGTFTSVKSAPFPLSIICLGDSDWKGIHAGCMTWPLDRKQNLLRYKHERRDSCLRNIFSIIAFI